ncbi:NAD(P)-dependent oxidoreductase [Aquirufa aurantiipilula]|uniref:NAD(P)-dependent oxidoreductase n=1 Tax=Aquirufa aurantiipilula TaxID=2696561 RepID=A0ABT6BKU8_9BACT|nr:NAD(P)-dependent oxidoreductase [Aquirufa aurantiipilula]MDF5691089.1 NAD(P)-dependent oxidoreductase [Aquirufa aurantiipilula]
MPAQVLIIDEVHESMAIGLEAMQFSVVDGSTWSKEEIIQQIAHFEGLVVRSKLKIDASFLTKAVSLRFIARAGAGLDLIDLEAAHQQNVAVFAANEGNKEAVAEHVIGQLLSLAHHLHKSDKEVRQGIWDREGNRGWEISGKTIGIIGYGHMGQSVTSRLSCFGSTMLVYDKYQPVSRYNAEIQDIFDHADIVSLHIPLTEETRGMVNEQWISQFKKPIVLINSSRGAITPLPALLSGLQSGQIQGLILDVLPNEKINTWSTEEKKIFDQISSYPSTLFSPHVAGWTNESYRKINEVLLAKIKAFYTA